MKYPGLVKLDLDDIQSQGYSVYAIKKLLTLSTTDYSGKEHSHAGFIEEDNGLYVPRAFNDFMFYKTESGDEGVPLKWKGDPKMTLRPYQEEAVKVTENYTRTCGGSILVGGCGTGKTVMGCFLIKKFGRRSLVLVHKEFLMQQFKSTLETAFPDMSVGLWQKDTIPSGDEDVVISMVQSLGAREYPKECYEGYGLIVTDEVHRFSAPQWSSAIGKFSARYRIGLTATPDRADGLQAIFMNNIGPIVHKVDGNLLSAEIYPIYTGVSYSHREFSAWDGTPSTAKLISRIAEDDTRSGVICNYAARAVKAGRKILMLTDRRSHVMFLRDKCADLAPDYHVSAYIGGLKKSAREEAEQADIIIGTYAMAQEGLDIPRLDTLIFASPKTNITQAVGRILRPFDGKQQAVVLDFIDDVGILHGYYKKRCRLYDENKYKIMNQSSIT